MTLAKSPRALLAFLVTAFLLSSLVAPLTSADSHEGGYGSSAPAEKPAEEAGEKGEPAFIGDPDFPWLHNQWYKVHLDIRARIGLADINGFENSEAYTIRTRAGLELGPWKGFSALAELENTYSPADSQYNDGTSKSNTDKSVISDPENTELNRAWGQYATKDFFDTGVGVKAKGGLQRIIFDDARWVGNVGWRQNEQTIAAALGQTDAGIENLTTQYSYFWNIQRIFGDQGPDPSAQDFDSDSHVVRLNYTGFENHDLTAFAYLFDFEGDSPGNSANSYGFRATGKFPLEEDWAIGYAASYAVQTDAGKNQVSYTAHYGWAGLDLIKKGLGKIGATYEHLGSDDGQARVVTALATAHKFNGFADAFLDNGGPKGLQDLFFTISPELPWKFKGSIIYHEFWRADGGAHLGREIDWVVTRPFNRFLSGLAKFGWFEGESRGPEDRWRLTFQLDFKY